MDFVMHKKLDLISPQPRKRSLDLLGEQMSSISFHGKNVGFIGLCGGQASGKTKIASYFQKNIPRSMIIAEKDFFKYDQKVNKIQSQDEPLVGDADGYSQSRKILLTELSNPECYDHDKWIEIWEQLKKGEKITISNYNDTDHSWKSNDKVLDPTKTRLFIIEGYFIYKNQKLREMFDLKLFTEVDDDVRLSRLILRENMYLKNNANAFKTFFLIYENYLKTSFETNIETGKKYANLILPNYEITDDDEIGANNDETLKFLLLNLQEINKR